MVMRTLLKSVSLLRPVTVRNNVPRTYFIPPCVRGITRKQFSLCTNPVQIPQVSFKVNAKNSEVKGLSEIKANLIQQLNFKTMEDALPFHKLPIKTLIHVYRVTKNDEKHGYCKNRLYYIASRIKCPPSVLSVQMAKRTFIYGLTFDWLQSSLSVLIEMGVPSDRIIRDLWVLKYQHETIRQRLQRVKDMGIDKLYPWMVRCSEDILNRFIHISQETKHILGESESESTHVYLANRLQVSLHSIEDICLKTPALKTIRVTKVKRFLDWLISEGFDVEQIAQKPRILASSQKTAHQRLETLRALGLSEINLNILCRSRKDFQKYCESLEAATKSSNNT